MTQIGEEEVCMHEYYSYDKAQLLDKPKIPLVILDSAEAVFKLIADEMLDIIQMKAWQNEPCVLICPVGPIGQYPYFVERVNCEKISLRHVWLINMDEYLTDDLQWIPVDHPLSFRGYMQREVYDRIHEELNIPAEQRIFPHPDNLSVISKILDRFGGVDAVFGGIGLNGHVAFNEPQSELTADGFLKLSTRVLWIDPETRACNAVGDFGGILEDMPKYCVTVGMKEMMSAKKIRLAVFRQWHRAVVRRAAYGEYSTAFPVTLLQKHPDIQILLPEYVAEK